MAIFNRQWLLEFPNFQDRVENNTAFIDLIGPRVGPRIGPRVGPRVAPDLDPSLVPNPSPSLAPNLPQPLRAAVKTPANRRRNL